MAAVIDPSPDLDREINLAIDKTINLYEVSHGLTLTNSQRSTVRRMARDQPKERPPQRHPLGNGAKPGENYHTPAVRSALRACLYAYWVDTRPDKPIRSTPLGLQPGKASAISDQINSRTDTATGLMLADRFVTLLDVGTSLQQVRIDEPELAKLLERRYRDHWTIAQLCQSGHYTQATYYRRETEAFDYLVDIIWVDWLG